MKTRCIEHLLSSGLDDALDIIQLSFQVIDSEIRHQRHQTKAANITDSPDEAIEELNQRFKEHGIGYQYLEGHLVRVDSQFAHAEIVKPALSLLNATGFQGSSDEFMKAFEHYRHGRNKEAVAEALKAFESAMQSICEARKWERPANATAKQLVETLLANKLVPSMLESHLTGLRTAMESGLPTVRNKTSGHGQGVEPVQLPDHVAAYALHLMASNIILLVEAHKNLK
jgi:AbiJ N-terminal domain 4